MCFFHTEVSIWNIDTFIKYSYDGYFEIKFYFTRKLYYRIRKNTLTEKNTTFWLFFLQNISHTYLLPWNPFQETFVIKFVAQQFQSVYCTCLLSLKYEKILQIPMPKMAKNLIGKNWNCRNPTAKDSAEHTCHTNQVIIYHPFKA